MISSHRSRLMLAGAALALILSFVSDVHAAVWISMNCTAPGDVETNDGHYVSGVGRYRVEAWNGTSWDSVRIYQAPGVEGVPVRPQGEPITFYVSQSIQPLTSRTYRFVAIDLRGNRAGSSNYVVYATGFPDTLVGLSRPAIPYGFGFMRAGAAPLSWTLRYGDSTEVHAAHQEEIQRAYRGRICQLYSSWALRGIQQACP